MDSEPGRAGSPEADHQMDNREPVEMEMGQSDEDTGHDNGDSNNNSDSYSHRNGDDPNEEQPRLLLSNIVQVTNISPCVTLDQMKTLFGFLGEILNIELYTSDQNSEINLKVCFVEFANPSSVLVAQHLTNTVFIDRALVVLPYGKQKIPDRETALHDLAGSQTSTNFNYGVVTQAVTGVGGVQMISTIDPRLTALGLPQYPQLPANTDPTRVEEIRRTVYIGNLDSSLPPEQVLKFFNDIGEVKYIRMAGDDTQPTRFAFVEFTHQSSIANALQQNGTVLGSRALKINHSNNAIVKPAPKSEIDDLARRTRDTPQDLNRDRNDSPRDDRYRDRHRDRDRYRREYSRSHRSRSRDRDRRPSRSRDHIPSRREHSKYQSPKKRSRSRDLKRRRSRSSERSRSRHHHKSSRR